LLGRGHVAQTNFHAGDELPKPGDQTRDQFERVKPEADSQTTAVASGETAASFNKSVESTHNWLRFFQELFSGTCEFCSVLSPLKKRTAQVLLHPPYLLGKRWLAQIEKTGCSTKVELLRKKYKGTKFTHVHNTMLSPK
jgi:hypothetical protein